MTGVLKGSPQAKKKLDTKIVLQFKRQGPIALQNIEKPVMPLGKLGG